MRYLFHYVVNPEPPLTWVTNLHSDEAARAIFILRQSLEPPRPQSPPYAPSHLSTGPPLYWELEHELRCNTRYKTLNPPKAWGLHKLSHYQQFFCLVFPAKTLFCPSIAALLDKWAKSYEHEEDAPRLPWLDKRQHARSPKRPQEDNDYQN